MTWRTPEVAGQSAVRAWNTGSAPTPSVLSVPVPDLIETERLHRMKVRDLWRAMKRQPLSFWLLLSYLLIEYVRPHQIYPSIDVLPWGKVTILGTLAALILEGRRFRVRTPATPLLLFFLAVVLASAITAYNRTVAFDYLHVMVSWVLVYFLITSLVTTEVRFILFTTAFLLYNFKMSQHAVRSWAMDGFAFRSWGATGSPGWFDNSGEYGIAMVVLLAVSGALVVSLAREWPRWKQCLAAVVPFSAAVAVIASSSRGAMLAGAVTAVWLALRSKFKLRALGGLMLVAALAWVLLPQETIDRFRLAGEDETSRSRITYFHDGVKITKEHPVLGVGYHNWFVYYTTFYNPKGQVPHNIFIQAAAELGLVGLGAFVALIVATFWVNAKTRALARQLPGNGRFHTAMSLGLDCSLIGYLVAGLFVTVLYYPFFWINLAMTVALQNATRHTLSLHARQLPSATVGSHPPHQERHGVLSGFPARRIPRRSI
jgi:O-antigen ligase